MRSWNEFCRVGYALAVVALLAVGLTADAKPLADAELLEESFLVDDFKIKD